MSLDLLGELHTLRVRNRTESSLGETTKCLGIVSKIDLGPDEDDGSGRAVVVDLRIPLGLDVLEGGWRDDGEASEEDISLRIRKWTKTIVILLTSSVPEAKVDGLAISHDVSAVVVKDCGDVLSREGVGCVRNEKAGLSDGSITDDDTLDGLHCHC